MRTKADKGEGFRVCGRPQRISADFNTSTAGTDYTSTGQCHDQRRTRRHACLLVSAYDIHVYHSSKTIDHWSTQTNHWSAVNSAVNEDDVIVIVRRLSGHRVH